MNAPGSRDESLNRCRRGKVFGVVHDARRGRRDAPDRYIAQLITLNRFLVYHLWTRNKWLQVVASRWVRVQQRNRSTASCFNEVWKTIAFEGEWLWVSAAVVTKLVAMICLSPLGYPDSRLRTSTMVSATDASQQGNEISCSARLAGLVQQKVQQLAVSSFLPNSEFFKLLKETWTGVENRKGAENARGMRLKDLRAVAETPQICLVFIRASLVGWPPRLRCWCLSWSINFANDFYLVWKAEKCIYPVYGEARRDPCANRLLRGSPWLGEDVDHPHPTLVRWTKRMCASLQLRGVELCTAAELADWAFWGYTVHPY